MHNDSTFRAHLVTDIHKFSLPPALHSCSASYEDISSSFKGFCVILEVSVYSFFQHLIQYSVIHTLAAATLFLNYLKYSPFLSIKFHPETIWFLTQTKTKYKNQGG